MNRTARRLLVVPALCATLTAVLIAMRTTGRLHVSDTSLGILCGVLVGIAFVAFVKGMRGSTKTKSF